MEWESTMRFARISARKARLVADVVRGMPVGAAMATLQFTPNKGAVLINLGRNEEASKVLDKASSLDSSHASAWVNKGTALINLGRYEQAAQALASVPTFTNPA